MALEPLAREGHFFHVYDFRIRAEIDPQVFIAAFNRFDYSDDNPMHRSGAQVKDGVLVQDVADPRRFWLIGEWRDIDEHARIRKILAEHTGLGVAEAVSSRHGAVSAEVTAGLAEGALQHSGAGVSVAVTGYAGPGGGSERDPVGTCYVAAARSGRPTRVVRQVFAGDRDAVRLAAVGEALDALIEQLS